MTIIENYICELLFNHDCVIIPGFGGIIANYDPSFIHPVQHTFTPPSKKLAFNRNLKSDDGLLANFICKKENISFDKARKKIESFVEHINFNLEQRKNVTISQVGDFFFDIEKNLQFRQDHSVNYLLDSYGLKIVQSPPIKREGIREAISRQLIDRPSIKPDRKPSVLTTKMKITFIAVPALAFFIGMGIYFDVLKKIGTFNYAYLTRFSTDSNVQLPVKNNTTNGNSLSSVIPIPVLTESLKTTAVADTTRTRLSETPKPAEMPSLKKYYIIAGAFRVRENAYKLIDSLKTSGCIQEIIGKNSRGLYVVAYSGFDDLDSARKELKYLKSERNNLAWLCDGCLDEQN